MPSKDILLRPFAYNFDVFLTCYNPRHVSYIDISPSHDNLCTLPPPSVLHHYFIRFSFNLLSLSPPLNDSPFPGLVVPPNNIIWLSFDSVIHSFGSQLTSRPGCIVQHYMLEASDLHFRVASYFHSRSSTYFTTLQHLFHHLHRLHHCSPLRSVLAPRIKPCAYHTLRLFFGHQSCYYVYDCRDLTLDLYVPSRNACRRDDTIKL